MPRTKACTKCGQPKDAVVGFHKDKATKDGLRTWCKDCARPAAIAYHRRNKQHVEKRNRKYRQKYPERYLVWVARHRAKKVGLAFDLREADIRIPARCPILGIPLFAGSLHNPNSPSLDRIDNSKGYVISNVHVISYRANVLKNNGSIGELKALSSWVRSTYGA